MQAEHRAGAGLPRRRHRLAERLGMSVAPGEKKRLPIAPTAARVRLRQLVGETATERHKLRDGGQAPLAINPGERRRQVIKRPHLVLYAALLMGVPGEGLKIRG